MDGNFRERLLSSCFRFLLPIAQLLLNAGISYREFDELAKRAFVITATTHYGIRGRPTSNSRVSIMTGLGRKEIARMRQEESVFSDDVRDVLGPLADLVSTWTTDPAWIDRAGKPKVLTYSEGKASFKRLAAETVGDRPVGAVRRELERLGTVDFSDEGAVRLRNPNLIPSAEDERLLSALSYSLRALAETVAHNCSGSRIDSPERIERYVESRDMTEEEAGRMKLIVAERLEEFSRELDALIGSKATESPESSRNTLKRIGIGLYYSE